MTGWTAAPVRANGITLNTYRTGGDRPPLVLLHGITDNGLCWKRAAQALERDYDLIMIDARGHGRSDAPPSGYSPDDHAADVAGVIRALGLERPALLGHSMGAMNAATVAANYPDLVRGLVMEDPPWQWETPTERQRTEALAEWRQGIQEQRSQTREALIAAKRAESPMWDPIEFDAWAESKLQTSPQVVEYITAARTPWRELVRRIACPTLLIYADADRGGLVTPAVAEEVRRLLPNGRVVHISGAGHNIRREQFESYLAAVTAFLAEVWQSPG